MLGNKPRTKIYRKPPENRIIKIYKYRRFWVEKQVPRKRPVFQRFYWLWIIGPLSTQTMWWTQTLQSLWRTPRRCWWLPAPVVYCPYWDPASSSARFYGYPQSEVLRGSWSCVWPSPTYCLLQVGISYNNSTFHNPFTFRPALHMRNTMSTSVKRLTHAKILWLKYIYVLLSWRQMSPRVTSRMWGNNNI